MNRKRLELMATMLREVIAGTWKPTVVLPGAKSPRKSVPRFDLEYWMNRPGSDCALRGCGFVACAVGHALLDKRFNDEGLVKSVTADGPWYQGDFSFDAVDKFFDLRRSTSQHLFAPGSYNETDRTDPKAVLARVEQLLKEPQL